MTQLIGLDGRPLRNVDVKKAHDSYMVVGANDCLMPWPKRHIRPEGEMVSCLESAAIWYFLQVAHVAMDELGSQVTLEGDEDSEIKLKQAARQIADAYGVRLEDMFSQTSFCLAKLEATRCGMVLDLRVESFILSGGQAYNDVDRKVT